MLFGDTRSQVLDTALKVLRRYRPFESVGHYIGVFRKAFYHELIDQLRGLLSRRD